MRMRKKKWAIPYLQAQSAIVISDPTILKGKWQQTLKTSTLNLEIGTGKGDYITNMSLKHPETGWIGLEKDANVACIAVKKIVEKNLNNILYINNDANNLLDYFAKNELDTIYLNFSDPWPKKGHTKRRLSSANFLNKYYEILKSDGKIIMKTDNYKLFNYSVVEILKNNFKLEELNVNFRSDEQDDPITEYEQKFLDLGQPIYRAIFKKTNL